MHPADGALGGCWFALAFEVVAATFSPKELPNT